MIINIQGDLSAELGSELYLNAKESLKQSSLLLLDMVGLENLDDIGIQFIHKIIRRAEENNSRLACANLPHKFWEKWDGEFASLIPRFPQRKDGIHYLESFLPNESKTEKLKSPERETAPIQKGLPVDGREGEKPVISHSEEKKPGPETVQNWVYCPHCSAILEIERIGNQACNHCNGKFYIHSNYHVTVYERLMD